jgi:antitoxin YefM
MEAIKTHVIVGENGKIEISSSSLEAGTTVEVIVLADETQDETQYLMSNDANRQHLLDGVAQLKHREKFVYVNPDAL